MIIGVTGYAGSGKDTFARALRLRHGFIRVAFADKLKNLAYDLNPILNEFYLDELTSENVIVNFYLKDLVDKVGWDRAKKHDAVRHYLQSLGEAVRATLGEDAWLRAANETVEAVMSAGKMDIVITDVRYENEASYVRSRGGKVVKIERPGLIRVNDHVTETNVDTLMADVKIVNDGSVTELGKKATDLIHSLGG